MVRIDVDFVWGSRLSAWNQVSQLPVEASYDTVFDTAVAAMQAFCPRALTELSLETSGYDAGEYCPVPDKLYRFHEKHGYIFVKPESSLLPAPGYLDQYKLTVGFKFVS